MSVTLVRGATTVTLPEPISGKDLREVKRQTINRTQGGTVKVHDLGVDTYEIDLTFEYLTAAEKSSLDSFFHTTVDGALNTFTYTDEFATGFTARFLNPTLEYVQIAKDMYNITFTLEVNAMGA